MNEWRLIIVRNSDMTWHAQLFDPQGFMARSTLTFTLWGARRWAKRTKKNSVKVPDRKYEIVEELVY